MTKGLIPSNYKSDNTTQNTTTHLQPDKPPYECVCVYNDNIVVRGRYFVLSMTTAHAKKQVYDWDWKGGGLGGGQRAVPSQWLKAGVNLSLSPIVFPGLAIPFWNGSCDCITPETIIPQKKKLALCGRRRREEPTRLTPVDKKQQHIIEIGPCLREH